MAAWVDLAAALVLVWVVFVNIRDGSIKNTSVYALIALFALKLIIAPAAVPIWATLLGAAIVFAAAMALFALGTFPAGGAKLAPAAALFLPFEWWLLLLAVFIASVFVFSFLAATIYKLFGNEESRWAILRKRYLPVAVPIALTAWIGMFAL